MIVFGLAVATLEPNINGTIKRSAFGRFFAQTSFISSVKEIVTGKSSPKKSIADWQKIPNRGESIAGYRVSSGYGKRPKPCPNCSDFHPAIDVATPVGTPLYAVANAQVKCWRDANGGGLVGEYTLPEGKLLQLLHLSDCKSGKVKAGDAIAKTGNSGIGTGAHLDVRLKPRIKPPTELIERTLSGKVIPPEEKKEKKLRFPFFLSSSQKQQKPSVRSKGYILPTQGTITRGLDRTAQDICSEHCGIDIANALGTPIIAVMDGEVVFAGEDIFGLGLAIKLKHANGTYSLYGHNQALLVRVGQTVKQGQTIAYMGNTGYSSGSHLHFELRAQDDSQKTEWLDPETVIDFSRLPRNPQ
ncbi:peptidoglycan DD-metalloendopeptidase family protein [Lusitaniella coriacea]|uniref:peptidoglycan DD-metalloendopeptidase family protein n=1 Tax=Lusitaniella coriacea TaxID=1983105 RepID=UPI003CF803A2